MSAGLAGAGLAVRHCNEWLFIAFVGVVQGIGYGMMYICTLQQLMQWSSPRLGAASGLLGISLGLGGMLWSAMNLFFINAGGADGALLATSGVVFVFLVLPSFAFQFPPSSMALTATSTPTRTPMAMAMTMAMDREHKSDLDGKSMALVSASAYEPSNQRRQVQATALSRVDILRAFEFWVGNECSCDIISCC
jgi:MFS family permease